MERAKLIAVLAALPVVAFGLAVPKESCTTSSSTSSFRDYVTSSYGLPPSRPTQGYTSDTYTVASYPTTYSQPAHSYPQQTYPRPGYSTQVSQPYYPETCRPKTVTSTHYKDSSSTTTITLPVSTCVVTETEVTSCSTATSTFTETLPVSTVVETTVTPAPSTTTITLTAPLPVTPILEIRDLATCTGGSTQPIVVTGYDENHVETVTVTPTGYYGDEACITQTEPAICESSTVSTTTTLDASTTLITSTAIPSIVTATLNPTTTFNVLRATGVVPIDDSEEELAIANSNNMYGNLRLMPGASDGSYAVTFDVGLTSPSEAAQFTIDDSRQFFGTGNGATNYIANTFYSDRSNRFYFSPSADPLGSTSGFPPILCSVDALTNVLSCENGAGASFKNQFALCSGSSFTGFNPNGNLFLTIDPEFTECAGVTILFEQVILYELIPPAETGLLPLPLDLN